MTEHEYRFGDFELKPGSRSLERDGLRVPLGAKAFDLLTVLVDNAGEVVSKQQLLKELWPNSFVEEANLSQQVFAIRRALGDCSGYIATVPGRGYQFAATVRREDPSPDEGDEIVIETNRERSRILIEEPVFAPPMQPAVSRHPLLAKRRIGAFTVVLATVAAGLVITGMRRPRKDFHSIVVADFVDTTGDRSFEPALKRALEIDLGQSPALNVMSAGEAVGTLRLMGDPAETALTGEIAREVCERSNREVLMSGTIASVGSEYLLTLEATDCDTGTKLAATKAQASSREEVLAAVDTVTDKIRSKLGESSATRDNYRVPIYQATTPSMEALKAFSIGQVMEAQGKDDAELVPFYQHSVELDPHFAMAWGALANAYYNMAEFDLAALTYKKAFDFSDRVSTREKLILRAHYYGEGLNDVVQAVNAYQLWAAMYPRDWVPQVNICNDYTQIGEYGAALPACERGLQMQPGRAISYSVLLRDLKDRGSFEQARTIGRQAIANGMDSTGVHSSLFLIALTARDDAAVSRETEWARVHSDSWYAWYFPFMQASAAATGGQLQQADRLFRTSYDVAERENLPEAARSILLDQAQEEFDLGLADEARASLLRLGPSDRAAKDAVLLRVELGESAAARKYLAEHEADANSSTLHEYVDLPKFRALLAMSEGHPQKAIEALEPARPYELADYSVLSLRAAAYEHAGQPDEAIAEYEEILANPGIDPTSPVYPMAYLRLARLYASRHNLVRSRAAYESFLAAWKLADADLPLLKAARSELKSLGSQAPHST